MIWFTLHELVTRLAELFLKSLPTFGPFFSRNGGNKGNPVNLRNNCTPILRENYGLTVQVKTNSVSYFPQSESENQGSEKICISLVSRYYRLSSIQFTLDSNDEIFIDIKLQINKSWNII